MKNKEQLYLITIIIIFIIHILILYYYNTPLIYREGWGKVGRAVNNAARQAADRARRAAEAAARRIQEAARRAAEAARRAAEAAARALRELENAYNRLVRATREMPGKITDGFSKLSTLKNEIVTLGNKVAGQWDKIEDLTRFPAKFSKDIADQSTDFFNQIKDGLEILMQEFRGYFTILFDIIKNDISSEFTTIFGKIRGFFEKLGRMIEQFFEMILNVLKNFFQGIFNEIKKFFTETFVNALTEVFNFILAIFEYIGKTILNLFKFLLAVPGCVPYWMKDSISKRIDNMLPNWLKWFNNNILFPIINFFVYIINTVLSLVGFNFNIKLDNDKCYPKFPFISKLIKIIKDFFELIINWFDNKKKKKKSSTNSSQDSLFSISQQQLSSINPLIPPLNLPAIDTSIMNFSTSFK